MMNKCPWCEAELEDLYFLFEPDFPDGLELDCESCGKPIYVEMRIEFDIVRGGEDWGRR